MADAKAIGYLELNIKGFQEAIGAAQRALAAFGVAVSAYKGIQFFKEGTKDAISFGNSIYIAAQQMGKMDVDKFFLVQKALENIGYSAEGARATMQEFILAGRPIAEIFGRDYTLNVTKKEKVVVDKANLQKDVNQLKIQTIPELKAPKLPELKAQALPQLKAEALPELKAPILPELKAPKLPDLKVQNVLSLKTPDLDKAKAPNAILDSQKNYAAALQNAANQYGKQAQILKDSAAVFSKVFEDMQAVASKVREFFLGMTQQFLKPLQALLETIQRIDLASIGAEFGRHIADAINTLNGLIKGGAPAFIQVLQSVTDVLTTGFGAAAQYAVDILLVGIHSAIVLFGGLMDSVDWGVVAKRIGSALVNAIISLTESIRLAINEAIPDNKFFRSLDSNKEKERQEIQGHATLMRIQARRDFGLEGENGSLIKTVDISKLLENAKIAVQNGVTALGDVFSYIVDKSPDLKQSLDKLYADLEAARKVGEATAASTPDKLAAFTYGTGDPARTIADSLARVGGGGNSIISGQNLQQKQVFLQERTLQAQLETNSLLKNFKPAAPITMGSASVGNQ
jgi:hypothetical protein